MPGCAGIHVAGQPTDRLLPRVRGAVPRTEVARLALFTILFVVALGPALTTPIPAMVDYLNHLARMYELAASGTADASPYYHAVWKFYPNLAMDILVPQLARWIGVELATRMFLIASQLLVVTGSIAIEVAVKRRFAVSGFIAVLYLFSIPFAWGFLNFEFALGVALWGIACWLVVREGAWPLRLATHTLFVVVLFAAHMFALGLYGATLGIHELWAAKRIAGQTMPVRRMFAAMVLLAIPAVAMAALMELAGGSVGGSNNVWAGLGKPLWPVLLLNGDNAVLSCLASVLLIFGLCELVKRREIRFEQSGLWLTAGFGFLYLAVPGRFFDTAFVDLRVLVGALMIVPAFTTVTFASPRRGRVAALIVSGLTLANVICVEAVWQSFQPVYRAMIASFGRIEPGARILVATSGGVDDPPIGHLADYAMYHAPTLAVHYAKAFVPTLFTTAGKQPITVAAGFERLTNSCGGPAPLAVLQAAIADGAGQHVPLFLRSWWRDFDYVYMLGPATADPVPGLLELVEAHPDFTLYRVRKLPHSNKSAGAA